MTTSVQGIAPQTEVRARQSEGASELAIYEMVARVLRERAKESERGGALVDVGCGSGQLWSLVQNNFTRYIGVDAVIYQGFPEDAAFYLADLNLGKTSLPCDCADVVVSVETIEHLENPRAFMRELVRLAKPGGWVVVTTPNQLSFLSLLTLIVKKRFSAFQDVHYPAHLTALLEVDLKRIAVECGLIHLSIEYSLQGRVVFTSAHYPRFLARIFPRALSDNLILMGKKAEAAA
jgi:2-polyprenyl-3-methyl-5-hydroxy-6-metoxy-1,4-benzoquinol methylase